VLSFLAFSFRSKALRDVGPALDELGAILPTAARRIGQSPPLVIARARPAGGALQRDLDAIMVIYEHAADSFSDGHLLQFRPVVEVKQLHPPDDSSS
jgi:hypothetical protein